jgi:WD40 repeat protein
MQRLGAICRQNEKESGHVLLRQIQRVLRFEAHAGTVHGIAFLPHDRYLITGGEDSVALVWDTQEVRSVCRFAEHLGPVTSVALSPGGRFVLTGSEDHTLRLWPLPASLEQPTEG